MRHHMRNLFWWHNCNSLFIVFVVYFSAKNLIKGLLKTDPDHRLDIQQVVQNKWIAVSTYISLHLLFLVFIYRPSLSWYALLRHAHSRLFSLSTLVHPCLLPSAPHFHRLFSLFFLGFVTFEFNLVTLCIRLLTVSYLQHVSRVASVFRSLVFYWLTS